MLTWMDIRNGRSDSGRVRCGSGVLGFVEPSFV